MSMWMEVHFGGGTPIQLAATQAIDLAARLGCAVKFKFNDVTCFAEPDGSPKLLAHNFLTAQDRGWQTASSRDNGGADRG